jgi:indolepyruvate ferredoxin oxidoreductase
MAPPLLSRELDPLGRPKKREFGPWMLTALSLMRRLKVLRGGPLDFFGRTEERRLERALIEDYRRDMEEALGVLSPATLGAAIELARVPEDIRGFGPVKLASIEKAKARRDVLFRTLKSAMNPAVAA